MKKSDLDKPKDRNTEEVEAESVAYTVCQHFGIDTSDYSFAYVATWGSGKDVPELKSSLETIRATANDLINGISDRLLDKEKTQEQTVNSHEKENKNIIGNTPYADIQDKQYFRLSSKTAEKVAAALTEQEVPFSGRINGDKTTLTIGKADVDKYKTIIAEVTGKEKKEPEKSSEWRMYVIPDLKTWADNGKSGPQTPIEYFSTFKEAKARFDELRNQPYNSEKAVANGRPAARLTLGIDSEKNKAALDILHVRNNKNCLVDDFTRCKPVLENKEAMGLIKQTAKEIGFDVAMVYKKLDNDRYANEPDMIPFDKWENPYFKEAKTVDKSNIIGNTPYKDITEKTFKKLPTEKALAVAEILKAENVAFSGRVDGDKTTITISKADNDKFRAALSQAENNTRMADILETQPVFNHFDVPLYLKTFEDAQKENKVDVFRESNKENMKCCKAINEAISENYHYPNFDSKAALEQVFKEYPIERIEHVVAARISISDWDQRFSDKSHKWAKDLVADLPDKVKERFPYYSINEHPGLVNMFAEQIMEKQLEIRQEVDKAVAENVQREFDEMEKKFDGEMPDKTITVKDMRDYGYEYSGMLPLRTERALEVYDNELADIHLLYDDGTEVTAETRSDIENHDGIFGVDTDEWSRALRLIEHNAKLEREEAGKEAIVLYGKDDAFGIYQLRDVPENRELHFASIDRLEKKGIEPNRESYVMVYSAKEDLSAVTNLSAFLENVFAKFNNNRPKDYEGHSLSVSDVVVVKKDGQLSAHYVDDTSFKELEKFGEVQKNHLRAVEDSIEQNDNSFDGIINNTPSVDELEKKAMKGEQISITELATAIQNEKKNENRKPEEKRSIRAYLRQAKEQKQPENKAVQKQKGMEL